MTENLKRAKEAFDAMPEADKKKILGQLENDQTKTVEADIDRWGGKDKASDSGKPTAQKPGGVAAEIEAWAKKK